MEEKREKHFVRDNLNSLNYSEKKTKQKSYKETL